MTISQQASDVRARARQGSLGAPVFATNLGRRLTLLNDDPQAVQIDDITVVAANDATYTVTINGSDSVFLADSSATTEEIRDGLIAAIEANPLARGAVNPTIKDADELTLTGLSPGLAFTLAVAATGGSLTPASVQVAASADAVGFARLVIDDGSPDDAVDLVGKLAKSTSLVAQVARATFTFVTSATYLVTIRDEVGDVIAQGETDAITNTATTTAAIAVTMNGLLPADSVLAADGATFVDFTAELAGRQFSVELGTNEEGQVGGALGGVAATTGPDNTTSVNLAALGVSLFSGIDPTTTIGGLTGEYAANAGMRVLASGNAIWVERPGAVSKGDPVFVELDGTGSDAGKFFTADSATRARLTPANALWERDGRTASDGVAALRVGFGL